MVNWKLKQAIAAKVRSQIELAVATGIDESRISRIVRGHSLPRSRELAALKRVLGRRAISETLGIGKRTETGGRKR